MRNEVQHFHGKVPSISFASLPFERHGFYTIVQAKKWKKEGILRPCSGISVVFLISGFVQQEHRAHAPDSN